MGLFFSCSVVSDFSSFEGSATTFSTSSFCSDLSSTFFFGCWLNDSDFISASNSKDNFSWALFACLVVVFLILARCVFASFSVETGTTSSTAATSLTAFATGADFFEGFSAFGFSSEAFCKSNIWVINSSFFKVLNFTELLKVKVF